MARRCFVIGRWVQLSLLSAILTTTGFRAVRITGAMEIRRIRMIDNVVWRRVLFPPREGFRAEGLARDKLSSLTQTLSQRERASKLN